MGVVSFGWYLRRTIITFDRIRWIIIDLRFWCALSPRTPRCRRNVPRNSRAFHTYSPERMSSCRKKMVT